MVEQSDRQRITELRARAAMFRRAASYMSLRAERVQMERYAASLEQEADALQHKVSAAAASRAQDIVEGVAGPEPLAAMKPEDTEAPALQEEATSQETAKSLFRNRAHRLRELAATVAEGDRELLLAIAAEYEDMAKTLPDVSNPNPT